MTTWPSPYSKSEKSHLFISAPFMNSQEEPEEGDGGALPQGLLPHAAMAPDHETADIMLKG